jgi:hypothetical protein
MTKKKQAKQFNYAVGFYWEGESGSVGCYAYHSEVHYGTLKEAKDFQKYCRNQQKSEPKDQRRDYRIFQLVEVME